MKGYESEEVRNQACLHPQMCEELEARICGMVNFGILYGCDAKMDGGGEESPCKQQVKY